MVGGLLLCPPATAQMQGPVQRKSAKSIREARKQKQAQANKKPEKPAVNRPGLFNVTKTGNDWYFEIPDSLIGRQFLTTTRFISTPSDIGKFAGEQVNQQVVYFEPKEADKLLLRAEFVINKSDSTQAIYNATSRSNTSPIIGAFKVESHQGGRYKIKVSQFFSDDNPAMGMPSFYKRGLQLTSQDPSMSFIDDIKSFPTNTEIRLTKTWYSSNSGIKAASATGRITFGLNISFILLPKTPMQGRYFDPRVGYFAMGFNEFSDDQQRMRRKQFITRWRLEPKDSADAERMKRGELVEPKKPIVYYIDPATPKQWRKYLIMGVNDWQKAFEKAGFKNAIIGKEWPENDSTMSTEDARYSMIRYLASPIENAYGPNVHDPRSGEILESHICWYHNVMNLVHDWYLIQAGSIDEAARKMKFNEELMGQLIRFVSSHEVGHTLGLRHNFGSSSTVPVEKLRDKDFVRQYGHTPSIMDYARFNYVAQPEDGMSPEDLFPRINDYDEWAIQWGYTPMWKAYDEESDHYELEKLITTKDVTAGSRLWFGDGETNRNDPRCQTEDLGDDAVLASTYGIKNLKREIKELPQWSYEGNDISNDNLWNLCEQVRMQFLRYLGHVASNIGGINKDFKTVNEPGAVYTPTSKEKQKRALGFLNEQVLQEPTWLRTDYTNRYLRYENDVTSYFARWASSTLFRPVRNGGLNDSYKVDEYLPDVMKMVFDELDSHKKVTDYRKTLQTYFVQDMIDTFNGGNTTYRAEILKALKLLKAKTAAAQNTGDSSTRAYWADLNDRIQRALVIK